MPLHLRVDQIADLEVCIRPFRAADPAFADQWEQMARFRDIIPAVEDIPAAENPVAAPHARQPFPDDL